MAGSYVSDAVLTIAHASKDQLVDLTKVINNDAFPGVVDRFMDEAVGRGHRVVQGHDFTYLPEIFDKFGLSGVGDYFAHLSKDIMSPDGIPMPFANEIGDAIGMSTMQKIDWLCLNIGDVVSGGFSIWHTTNVIDMLQTGDLSGGMISHVLIGAGAKIVFSLASPNPIGLACGIVDMAALAYYTYPIYREYLFGSETFLEQALETFAAGTGIAIVLTSVIEGLHKLRALCRRGISFAEYLSEIAKKTVITDIISGCASLAVFSLSLITGVATKMSPLVACLSVVARSFYDKNREMIRKLSTVVSFTLETKQGVIDSYEYLSKKLEHVFYDKDQMILKPQYARLWQDNAKKHS